MANAMDNGSKRPAVMIVAVAGLVLAAAAYVVTAYLQWSGNTILKQADAIARLEEREANRVQYFAEKFADLRSQLAEVKQRLELQARVERLEDLLRRERFRRWGGRDTGEPTGDGE
ncbi:MAG TPA: hypothetical protein VGA50_04700 [Kiloniellales bacterium]